MRIILPPFLFVLLPRLLLVLGAACFFGAAPARAAFIPRILMNHPDGNAGGDYGLRIDLAGEPAQTFNFEDAGAFVTLSFDSASNTGTITGTVLHSQSDSNDLWQIVVDLEVHTITDDGTIWNTSDVSGNLYDAILDDMESSADSVFGLGETFLKNELNAADRLAFEIVHLPMTFSGVTPDFIFPGQSLGTVELNQDPTGANDNQLPFMFAKGHRDPTNMIIGFGWLTDGDTGNETRDFLFKVGPPIPEPSSVVLFTTGLLIVGAALRKRRDS